MYYLNAISEITLPNGFLRTKFICIIWTEADKKAGYRVFLRTKFICIIWTKDWFYMCIERFLRTKFICIIWTNFDKLERCCSSWGLSLFVLFEPRNIFRYCKPSSWGLSLFVLFEPTISSLITVNGSWGLSLFVLFELHQIYSLLECVLED